MTPRLTASHLEDGGDETELRDKLETATESSVFDVLTDSMASRDY